MLYLTCTTITSIDLAHYGVSRAKDWVSVKCGTKTKIVTARKKFSRSFHRNRNNCLDGLLQIYSFDGYIKMIR